MSCYCCSNTFDYCRIVSCLGVLPLGINAEETGNYQLHVDYLDSIQRISKPFTVGQTLEFDVTDLNENYVFTARLYSPSGVQIKRTYGEVEYDCFRFQTIFAFGTVQEAEEIQQVIRIYGTDFDENGVFLGEGLADVKAIYDSGLPNFLTSDQWEFVYDVDLTTVIGIKVLVGINPEDVYYLFNNVITLP